MFDGVSWAAGEIALFMIFATLVGFAIGWIFGRWLLRGSIADRYQADLNAQRELARKAEHRLVESNSALDKLHEQLRHESEKVGELEAQLGASQQTVSDLALELAAAGGSDEAFSQLRGDLNAARAEVNLQTGEIDVLRERLDAAEHAGSELEAKLGAATEQAARVGDLERRLSETDEQLDAARRDAERATELETRLRTADAATADLVAKLSAAEDRIASAARLPEELSDARAELGRRASTIAELESHVASAQRTVAELEERLGAAEAKAADMDSLRAELEDSAAARAELSERIGHLETELATNQSTVAELEAELAARPPAELTKDEARSRIGTVAERTAGGMPVADDDLKMVHGIGPKLEGMLKDMGITSFRQIANFEPGDIAIVTAALDGFRGRIERDDWMSSAAAQHLDKYGEDHRLEM